MYVELLTRCRVMACRYPNMYSICMSYVYLKCMFSSMSSLITYQCQLKKRKKITHETAFVFAASQFCFYVALNYFCFLFSPISSHHLHLPAVRYCHPPYPPHPPCIVTLHSSLTPARSPSAADSSRDEFDASHAV